ncbi:MAG: murein biosynthesis integral membrane protein MurJ [Polyangiaceae bacterium]|nr:murein biosynthesis integral membrane protein MurJ [Polyangiaceae bacterium]
MTRATSTYHNPAAPATWLVYGPVTLPAQGSAPSGDGGRAAAALVTIGIVASRLAGFVRQRVVAHYLGTSAAADAVAAAFRIGNLTQNLLGEGTLSASFIPVYVRLRLESAGVAGRFARAALGALITIATVLSLLGVLFAPALAGVLAPGFDAPTEALTAELLRVLFPMTGVLVLGAWALGVLTSHRRFLLPYAVPVVWSGAQIAALVVAGSALHLGTEAIARSVAWGALGGAVLQLAIMLLPVRGILDGLAPVLDTRAEGLREAARNVPGAILGRGVIQLSGLVDTMLASLVGAGAVATLGYAQTIYLLPMAVLGTGEAAAALPEMAARSAADEAGRASLREALGRSLARVMALGLPAAAVLLALSLEITSLLFRGGSFGASSADDVARVLAFYAAGLPANAASRVVSVTSFALGDTSRPARFAVVRVVVSTAIALATLRFLGVAGIVLGAAIAAWVELALLSRHVSTKIGGLGLEHVPFSRIVAVAFASAGAGLAVRFAARSLELHSLVASALVVAASGIAFLVSIQALRVVSLRSILRPRR